MRLLDKLRLSYANKVNKPTVLFLDKPDWKRWIQRKIRKHSPFFYHFTHEINPNNFDLVVPLTLAAQRHINENPNWINPKKVLSPSNECIDLCDDKLIFHKFLNESGYADMAPKFNQSFDYPYVIKKRIGAWGNGVFIIRNSQDELAHQKELESEDYFREEFIPGQEEYAAHIIMVNGKAVFLKTLEYRFKEQYFVKGPLFKPATREVDHSHFLPIFEEILAKINYQGISCFNYKLVHGSLCIYEINPRYGGSLSRFITDALIAYRKAVQQV